MGKNVTLGGIGLNCMKCGTEIEGGNVFCGSCLTDMDKYPVKPGTRILLPNHPAPESVKKQPVRKRPPTVAQKLKKTQKVLKWVTVALVVSLLMLGFTLSMLIEYVTPKDPQENIGQNYNTIGSQSDTN